MFPIYHLDGKTKLPKNGIYFVVAREGLFMHKDTGLVSGLVKVNDISWLESLQPTATVNMPKLPRQITCQTLEFFRWAQKRFHSEAAVLLFYHPGENKYLLHCPQQNVTHSGVRYSRGDRFEGFKLVGSIHSHNNFGAFHSGVDTNDEKDFDGIHITLGDVDKEFFTVTCSVVVNNNRFPIKPEKVLEGVREASKDLTKTVTPDPIPLTNHAQVQQASGAKTNWWQNFSRNKSYCKPVYDVLIKGQSCQRNWPFPAIWKKRVKGNYFGYGGYSGHNVGSTGYEQFETWDGSRNVRSQAPVHYRGPAGGNIGEETLSERVAIIFEDVGNLFKRMFCDPKKIVEQKSQDLQKKNAVKPATPAKTVKPTQQAKPSTSVKSATPAKTVKPGKPSTSAKTVRPTQQVKPKKSSAAVKKVRPSTPAKPEVSKTA